MPPTTKITLTKHNEVVAHDGRTRCVTIGPYSGLVLATGGDDNCICIWRLGKPASILSFRDQKRAITSLAFSPQERYLAVGSEGGAVKVISLANQKTKCTIPGAHKTSVTTIDWLSEHTNIVATGGLDGRVTLMDIQSASIINTYQYRSNNLTSNNKATVGEITCIKFAPNGKWLAIGDNLGRIIIYELHTGRTLVCWERTTTTISTSSSSNNTNSNSNEPLYHIPASSSNDINSSSSSNTSNNGHRGSITCLEFHPTELILVSGGTDHTIRFWSLDPQNNWGLLATSPADTGNIKALAFITPREHQIDINNDDDVPLCIAVASITDTHIRIWTVPTLWDTKITDTTYTLDIIDTRGWNGAATCWIGANIRTKETNAVNNNDPYQQLQLVVACIENSFMRAYGLDLTTVAPLNGNLTPLNADSRLSSSNTNNTNTNTTNNTRSVSRGPNRTSVSSNTPNTNTTTTTNKRSNSRGKEYKENDNDDNDYSTNIQENQLRYMNIPINNKPKSTRKSQPPPRVAQINLYSNDDYDDESDDYDDDFSNTERSYNTNDIDNNSELSPIQDKKSYTKPASLSVYRQLLEKNIGKPLNTNEENKEDTTTTSSSTPLSPTNINISNINSSTSVTTNPTTQPSTSVPPVRRGVPNMDGVNAALLQVASIKNMVTNISQQQQAAKQQVNNIILDNEIHQALGQSIPLSPSTPTVSSQTPKETQQRSRGSSVESLGGISEFRPLTANGSAGPPLVGIPTEVLVQYSQQSKSSASKDRTEISSPKFTIDDLQNNQYEYKSNEEESKLNSPISKSQISNLLSPTTNTINLNATLGIGLDEISAAIQQQENLQYNNPDKITPVKTIQSSPAILKDPNSMVTPDKQPIVPLLPISNTVVTPSSNHNVLSSRSTNNNITPNQPRALGDFVPSTRNHPIGISFEAFLPDNNASGFGDSRVQPLAASQAFYRGNEMNTFEEKITTTIQNNRDSYLRKLRKRCKTIAISTQMWNDGDIFASIDYILNNSNNDIMINNDILSAITGSTKELRMVTKQDIFGFSIPNSIQITPCSLSGSGTGIFESLSLNLDKSLSILNLCYTTIINNLVDDITLTVAVFAISTIFRAFSTHIRTTRMTYLGPIPPSSNPLDIHISLQHIDQLRLEPGIEDRLKRCSTAIEYLELIRTRLVNILSTTNNSSQNKRLSSDNNIATASTSTTQAKISLVAAIKSFMLQYETWRNTL